MMDEVANFRDRFMTIVADCERLCFMTRAKELQIEAIERLARLGEDASDLKAMAVTAQDEDSANALLSLQEMVHAIQSELRMWVSLKDDDAAAAWDNLVAAQSALHTAMQAYSVAEPLRNYVGRLIVLEQTLFPPLTFFSVGMTVKRAECSICGQDYGECEHIKCIPYMGEICCRIIKEAEIREVSIVSEPANKQCRIVSITDEQGVHRDFLTWREAALTGVAANGAGTTELTDDIDLHSTGVDIQGGEHDDRTSH